MRSGAERDEEQGEEQGEEQDEERGRQSRVRSEGEVQRRVRSGEEERCIAGMKRDAALGEES